jgi:hypothetical protein
MTATEILAEAQRNGIQLSTTPTGKVRYRGGLPAALRQAIADHKGDLLPLLPPEQPASAWDAAEADRILAPAVALVSRPGYGSVDPAVFRQQVAASHAVDDAWLAKDMAGLRLATRAFLRLFNAIEVTRTEPVA